jgi:hypothetical protein
MSPQLNHLPVWPEGRGSRANIADRFGAERANLASWALTTGDPLADAIVAEIHSGHPGVAVALSNGVLNGLDSLTDTTPAVTALLTQTERCPNVIDSDLYDHGVAPFYTSPGPVHLISLSAGALIRVYGSPSIAEVLATTGKLVDGAERRIMETGQWLATVMLAGSLRAGQPGYTATLQVRMLHAHMRYLARHKGYEESSLGAPINQIDLARTWTDFTLTSFVAEAAMGFELTADERGTLFTYWHLVAHLLGIDSRMIEGVTGSGSAKQLDDFLQALTRAPVAESAALAAATIDSIAHLLHEALPIPEGMAVQGLRALARRFHGDDVADALRIPKSEVADAVIAEAIHGVRLLRGHKRKDPKAWAAEQEKNLSDSRNRLGQNPVPTEYERRTAT